VSVAEWMILHKTECNGRFTNRNQYLKSLNHAFSEHFENLDQYKHEDNFKRVLRTLSINDVKDAIGRAKTIMQANKENGYPLRQCWGYSYYSENPSLTIWESIETILVTCGLLAKENKK
jgi:hypothetical protein